MCAVPNMAVYCNYLISCCPGALLRYVLNNREMVIEKAKQSRNRPGVSQRVPGRLGSQIFITFGT
jgi:hypothetical protein